ncbi:MAG: ABC transporter permease [Burkholderiales bacterium]|nr:ABC transporter permease [Burkholderiales bacterium]
MKRLGLLEWLAPVVVGCVVLLLWQALVEVFDVPSYLVPGPWLVAKTLVADRAVLLQSLGFTLAVAILALAAAVVIGVIVAFVFVQSRALEMSLFPYVVLLQVTPIVAIAPLIIIWVNDPLPALVICATIVALFPMISNTTLGLKSVDTGLLDLFRLNGATRWQTLMRLRVPTALPYFFAGLKISTGLALIGAVVAEFVAGTGGTASGLAYQILQAGLQLNIPRLFAALVLITVTGVVLFLIASLVAWLALRRWHDSAIDRS